MPKTVLGPLRVQRKYLPGSLARKATILDDVAAIFDTRFVGRRYGSAGGMVGERRPCHVLLEVIVRVDPKSRE